MLPEERVSLSRADDDAERKAIADVVKYGVHILHVFGERGEPRFSYTVGLWHSCRHPEVLIFGLKEDLCHAVLNDINRKIASGKSFCSGTSSDDILAGFRCYFEAIPASVFREYFGWDLWFYGGDEFEAVQLVWPNTSGVFPWQSAASDELQRLEPMLCKVPQIVC